MRKLISKKDKPKIIKEGQFLRLIQHGGWEYSQRTNCTGIVVIIGMTEDKRVILTKQFRPPIKKHCIEFPAGLVNDRGLKSKESMSTAARREMLEETGYHAKKLTKIICGPVSPGSSSDLMTLFLAQGLTKKSSGGGDQSENIEVCEIPFKTVTQWVKKMESTGCLVDPKVFAGLYFLMQYS